MGNNKFFNKFLEKASALGNQKHMATLRDSFALLTPLIIAGALSVLLRSFIFGGAGAVSTSILGWIAYWSGDISYDPNGVWIFTAGTGFDQASQIGNFLFYSVTHATIDSMAIFAAFGIGYFLSKIRQNDTPVIAGLVSLGGFLVAIQANAALFGANGLLTAIIVGILSTELYCLFSKSKKLLITMPQGVPPAVAKSFAKLFPTILVVFIVTMLNLPFILFGMLTKTPPMAGGDATTWPTWTLGLAILNGVQAPFLSFVGQSNVGLGLALIYTIFAGLFWFFGLHGTNILMGVFSPIYMALYAENVKGAHHIFVQGTFDAFIFLGGMGSTLAFIIAVFVFSNNKAEKEIAKLSIGPGIFQINEPIIFGTPMILNIKYVIPFILTAPILTITTWIGFKLFGIHSVTVLIPWTTPVGIGGLLATALDWKGLILALLNFGIAFAIWTPFVMIGTRKGIKEKELLKKESKKTKEAKKAMGGSK